MAENIWDSLVTVCQWIWSNIFYINILLSIIIVFFQRRDPKSVWTWLMALYFIPIVGFILYLLICQDYRKSKMFKVKEVEDGLKNTVELQERMILSKQYRVNNPELEDYVDLTLYNLENSGAVYTSNNDIQIFSDGVEKFQDVISELKKATDHIHMQYYIIKNDDLFTEIRQVLMEKAREGVEVRLLYDAMGCRMLPQKVLDEMRSAGVQIAVFFPAFLRWFHFRMNYRNHRKIIVIDNRIGYVGGFNIGKEYISQDPKFGYWRDTHLKLWGPSVTGLQIRFALDWNFAAKNNLFRVARYFTQDSIYPGSKGVQIIASGPDSRDEGIRDTYLRLIHKAKHHIYIQTPYFIPDESIYTALIIAIKSGIDVRIMIPCKPDHPFVYWATYSYIGDMIEAGGKCYAYQNGFLHAKGLSVDGLVSCYGTANMDIRSFELNFEVNAVIYDEETTGELERIFEKDMILCKEITREVYESRNLWIKCKEQVSRLLSPLL